MSEQHDLPEGAADSIKTPSLASSGLPPLTPHGSDATADADEAGGADGPDSSVAADGSVEDAALSAGADPDLRTDADVDADPR